MTKIHTLKCDPAQWEDVFENRKRFEIRKADRDYAVGDYLDLMQTKKAHFDLAPGEVAQLSGRRCTRLVTHVFADVRYGVPPGHCILSIRALNKEERETSIEVRRAATGAA